MNARLLRILRRRVRRRGRESRGVRRTHGETGEHEGAKHQGFFDTIEHVIISSFIRRINDCPGSEENMRFVDKLRKYRVALRSIAQCYTSCIGTRFRLLQTFSERLELHIEVHQVPYFLAVNGTCAMSSDCVNAKCVQIDSAMPFIWMVVFNDSAFDRRHLFNSARINRTRKTIPRCGGRDSCWL
jgi:hypothetical protein